VGWLPDLYGEGDKSWEKVQILSHNQVARVAQFSVQANNMGP